MTNNFYISHDHMNDGGKKNTSLLSGDRSYCTLNLGLEKFSIKFIFKYFAGMRSPHG
ncbi:hypothetical protein [Nostoc sp. CCY0012]|uniref:hypothetical protein n=1 Tax=Nostoc sp. CCY0012 TaxID=1056123 RepID=UPI0039C684B0